MTDKTLIETTGPFRFVTRKVWRHHDGTEERWDSRGHRKRLNPSPQPGSPWNIAQMLWMPSQLNWWIGGLFSLGACLFVLASLLSLMPDTASRLQVSVGWLNATFFIGSIPFTLAAYLQLLQSANQVDRVGQKQDSRIHYFGWQPRNVGWLSCMLQFIGTVFFNFNTLDAMAPSLTWIEYDLAVWVPNILGSTLFLASGYLAFTEVCHRPWAWNPASLSWWCVFINLLGCVSFMCSGIVSILLPGGPNPTLAVLALGSTLAGALCFFLGSVLLIVESAHS